VLSRAAGLGDIRKIGSGNIGATNVLRTGNKGLAAATLLLDGLKATVAVLLVNHWYGQGPAHAAALGAFLGHAFPASIGFKGGKGVATYIGALFALAAPAALAFCGIWLAVAYVKRVSSLAAIVASIATPLILAWTGHLVTAGLFAVMTALLLWFHRANIARLRAGTEPTIGQSETANPGNGASGAARA
jgi:acyl phosphate:glycerol-3-phosphate acyltransferase